MLWHELFGDLPDGESLLVHLVRAPLRLLVALILGGIVGFERQREGKSAGIRTHMLVSLGSALFTLVPMEAGLHIAELSRVIQGIAAGIGFLGAGSILKLSDQGEVKGLTSAAGIWVTAAVGMAVGAGILWPAISGVILAWIVLDTLHRVEHHFKMECKHKLRQDPGSAPVQPKRGGDGEE